MRRGSSLCTCCNASCDHCILDTEHAVQIEISAQHRISSREEYCALRAPQIIHHRDEEREWSCENRCTLRNHNSANEGALLYIGSTRERHGAGAACNNSAVHGEGIRVWERSIEELHENVLKSSERIIVMHKELELCRKSRSNESYAILWSRLE